MTTKKQEVHKVPNLRFPEFEGEWESKKLSEIAERVIRKNKENNQNILTISAQFGLISQLEFFNKSVSAKDVTGYYLLHKNDFAYNKSYSNGYPMGAIKRLNRYEKGVVSTLYICFKFNDCIDNAFVEQSFETGNQNSEIEKVAQEGARNHGLLNIGVSDFFNIKLNIPSLSEQKIIASFLTLINERIQCQIKIIEGLKCFKSAVSKKLFSQELQFSFSTSIWRNIKLGEICEKQSSNISANKIENNFGEYVIYGASGELKKIDFYDVEDDYISIVKDGAGVGRLSYCKGKSSVLGTLDIIKPKIGINSYFLYCLLSNIDFSKYVTGSTIPHIYYKDYANEIIEIPTIEEQVFIANFLFDINEKIELETSLLQQLKLQKQYFLRQMFI